MTVKGQNSREDKRKMAREVDAWTIPTYVRHKKKLVDNEVISIAKIWRHLRRKRKCSSGSSRPSN